MPSIFLFAGFIECSSLRLPRPFRSRNSRKQPAKSLDGPETTTKRGNERAMTRNLSGNWTDSTESLYSHSSSDSASTMESLAFQKGAKVVSNEEHIDSVEVFIPAEPFYFMPMERFDRKSTSSDDSWGYFVDVED